MKIDIMYLDSLNPCRDRIQNYFTHYGTDCFTISEFLSLDKISYEDKLWVWQRFTTPSEAARFALVCASSVLHLFETKYPNDDRPRKALEASKTCITAASIDINMADVYAALAVAAHTADPGAHCAADAIAYCGIATGTLIAEDTVLTAAVSAAHCSILAFADIDSKKTQQEKNLQFLKEIYQGR